MRECDKIDDDGAARARVAPRPSAWYRSAMATNAQIARLLYQLADALDASGQKDAGFRVRALRAGARTIDALAESAEALLARGALTAVKGIGDGLARRVDEIVKTGTMADLEALKQTVSPSLAVLGQVEGIGPKTAQLLFEALGIVDLDGLEAAARAGKLRALPRWSAHKEEAVIAAVARARQVTGRMRLALAEREARAMKDRLAAVAGVRQIAFAGSLRRRKETVGDVDILVAADDLDAVSAAFVEAGMVAHVLAHGPTRSSVKTSGGLQIDLRAVAPECWGAALHYFTGSKEHNIAIRSRALKLGLKVNEYGVFRGDERVAGATEAEVFGALGLPWIAPELREGQGEIEAAEAGRLPALLELADLRGDLHMHTDASDGRSTLGEMAQAAIALGREYIAITDHSQNLRIARGLDADRLAEQSDAIDSLNAALGGRLRVLKGLEADILPDGTVDMPESLARLEWRIGSLHSHFTLPRDEQTRRVIRAMESGLVDVIGHPTGRLLESRAPADLDMEAVIIAAARTGVALEVNAFPDRLDLSDAHCRLARELGAWLVIDTDAHAAGHLSGLHFGVDVARRGWVEARHVLNALPLGDLLRRPRPPRP